MVSKEALKLYRYLVPQGSLLIVSSDYPENLKVVGVADGVSVA